VAVAAVHRKVGNGLGIAIIVIAIVVVVLIIICVRKDGHIFIAAGGGWDDWLFF
jgi:hypothetical protein